MPVATDPLASARSAEEAHRWQDCLEAFRASAEAPAVQIEALAGASRCALRADRYQEALELAERASRAGQATRIGAENPRVRIALGEALIRAGELERARVLFDAASTELPRDARAHLGRARMQLAAGETGPGIESLRRAYELAPDDPDVLLRYAGAAAKRSDSVAILERYLALSEGDDSERRDSIRATVASWRALGDREVWIPRDPPAQAEFPLRTISSAPGVTDGFTLELSAPAAGGREGKRVTLRCLLDTGASGLFLSPRAAARLAREPLAQGTIFGGGGTGRHETLRVILPDISLGPARTVVWLDALVHVAEDELDRSGRFEGIVGADIFDAFRLTLDLPARRLRLVSPQEDPGSGGSGTRSRPDGDDAVQVWNIEGQLLVRVGLNGDAGGLMMVDTGADRTVLDLAAASRLEGLRREKRSTATYGFGGAIDRAEDISGLALRLPPLEEKKGFALGIDLSRRSRLTGVAIAGYLGLDQLRRYVLVFDPGQFHMRLIDPRRKER